MTESRRAVDEQLLLQAFARLSPGAMGVSLGLVTGIGLFAATASLLVRAALGIGRPGPVGPHLALLATVLPGYSVSWIGALVGFGWSFALGLVLGVSMAWLLNLNHAIYIHLLQRRIRRREILDGF